ncbi:leucine-rich repeat-containing protein 42-like [Octopus sinensis]|uniref:Leucine-rich repeat-containing protein 42 n=1 Tax=Octopus sinensis TaxID=2607531 RepID=A0A7E6ES79_9MOLL|nr:leucine-rich repeat-containing protein 42-like [Octopus sinensis]
MDDTAFFTFEPKPLQTICIEFLVGNLDIYQSLHTLPVTVAQEIFIAADHNNQFSIPSTTVFKRLELFSSTFTKYFVSSLSLRHSSHLINYLSSEFTVFSGVTSLDLSHCKLGDRHSILSQLNYFTNLTLLALRDNGLSHRGIDHMTISLRLLRGGQRNLQYLDISDNQDLDACCLEYLKVFSELKYLDISNTAISNKDSALRKFPLKIFLSSTKVDYEDIKEDMFRIETLGWASHVFNSWSKWYKNKTKRSKHRQYAPYPKKKMKKTKNKGRGNFQLILIK